MCKGDLDKVEWVKNKTEILSVHFSVFKFVRVGVRATNQRPWERVGVSSGQPGPGTIGCHRLPYPGNTL